MKIQELAARAPRSIPPAADLWPGIEGALRRRARLRRIGIRAVLVSGAVALTALPVGLLVARSARLAAAQAALAPFEGASAAYERSRAELLASLDAMREELGADSVERVKQDLGVIDREIEEVRFAMEKDPTSRELAFDLARLYARSRGIIGGTALVVARPAVYVKR